MELLLLFFKEVIRMNYGEKVLSRALTPGFLIIIVGAVVVYTAGLTTRKVSNEETRAKANVAVKAVGCVIAFIGAILLFA